MELFDKVKSAFTGFSKMLSSIDVPNTDDQNEELSNELKEQLAFADSFAFKTSEMIKHKKEKTFTAKFNNQAKIEEKEEMQRNSHDMNKDERER